MSVPRILILTAPYGSGHDRAAAALARALATDGARAEVLDHFQRFVSPAFARVSCHLFWAVLRWAPALWGFAYALSARLPTRSPAMGGMDRLGARALGAYLTETKPDAVVHMHPTSAGALAWLRDGGRVAVPHAIVFTDFAAHPQWIYPGVDRYFVPAESVHAGLVALGVPADRVIVSGIPIDPAFALPADRRALRARLGLPAEAPAVLVMGGMRGALGDIGAVCRVLAGLRVPLGVVAVCGDHAALARRLRARFGGDPRFRILGRVGNMPEVMGAVDLVVTKAGALTCAEALALEVPLVLYGSLPGHERANEACVEGAGAGVRVSHRAALGGALEALLREPGTRVRLAAGTRRLRRPEAGRTVAKEILALVGKG